MNSSEKRQRILLAIVTRANREELWDTQLKNVDLFNLTVDIWEALDED